MSGHDASADDGEFSDDEFFDDEVVRSFMLTRGRTRASVEELSIETLVKSAAEVQHDMSGLPFEHREIVSMLDGSMSVAEISAHHQMPLRAAIVLVSEMVAAGTLEPGIAVDSGSLDADFLSKIRSALQLL